MGAYGYAYLGSAHGVDGAWALGLPSSIAALLAVALAALAGALFSPVARRLRGLYLGIATLGLVFIGQFVMLNAEPLTGSTSGRESPDLSIFGVNLSGTEPAFSLFGVPFGRLERLWFVGVLVAAFCVWFARNLRDSRFGRQLQNIRDNEVAAAVLGVNVQKAKAYVFTISSAYAGAAGVLLALAYEQVVPDAFGLQASIDYTVMIVIGGMGSITGAAIGGAIVAAVPQLLDHYSQSLPIIAATDTQSAMGPTYMSNMVYALLVIVILLFLPGGLRGVASSSRRYVSSLLSIRRRSS